MYVVAINDYLENLVQGAMHATKSVPSNSANEISQTEFWCKQAQTLQKLISTRVCLEKKSKSEENSAFCAEDSSKDMPQIEDFAAVVGARAVGVACGVVRA